MSRPLTAPFHAMFESQATAPATGPAMGPGQRTPAGPAGPGPRPRRPASPRAGRPHATSRHTDERWHLAQSFAQLYLEVEAGLRPPTLLYPLMDARLVQRLLRSWVRGGPPGRVLRVRGAARGPRKYDAVAVVERRERVSALVLQLVRDSRGWRVSEAATPEEALTAR